MEYQIVKSLHVISVIAWMAGLFYLPRLFVYHAEVISDGTQDQTFKVMERRLYRGIMTPASVGTWTFGIWLVILVPDWTHETWFLVKLVFVLILTFFHHMLGRWVKVFASGKNQRTSRFYRIVNELPTLAILVIVPMVVIKPF
jgi:putative membrane protein